MESTQAADPRGKGVDVEDLHIAYPVTSGSVGVVRGVSFAVAPGQTLAIVGESGAGKSLTARSLLGLLPEPTYVTAGSVRIAGVEVVQTDQRAMRHLRGGLVGFIPQDPMSALNPVRRIGLIFDEVLSRHTALSGKQRREHTLTVLNGVGLTHDVLNRYPHELSGGMKQRILIALALVTEPSVIVADEPTTALDATIQAQILELLSQRVAGRVALILITHDLGVAATVCERIAIMYAGKIVETGTTRSLLQQPRHPYTRGLLAAAPDFSTEGTGLVPIPGSPPRPTQIPPGCAFAPRCSRSDERCQTMPELDAADPSVACWHPFN